jgi:uncharacterized protein (DUF427 family)
MATGPKITIEQSNQPVTVTWQGHVVARSTNALELREGSYPPVLYVPRADADMAYFSRTDRQTTCPHKGVASYFSLTHAGATDANSVWTYETPKAGVEAIAGHLAFYPDKVVIARG